MPGSDSEPEPYAESFEVQWAHLDANRHVCNTAYMDFATHVRFCFLADHGFPPAEFARANLGPVILREEIHYLKEVGIDDTVTVDYRLAAARPDQSRFRLAHRIFRRDGALAATIHTDGGWMDLAARKLVAPPPKLSQALDRLVRTEDFEVL